MRRTWFSGRAIGLHVTLLAVVPTFIALFLWQVRRATSGNELSWAYVFEWPFFTAYALYLWWRLVHDQPEPGARTTEPGARGADGAPCGEAQGGTPGTRPRDESATADDSEDEELAAYNRYLAQLDASGRTKRW